MNSFELPKQSHKVLPVPKYDGKKQLSHNEKTGKLATQKNSSNAKLPTLKAYLDGDENISLNRNALQTHAAPSHRVDSQQIERSKNKIV